MTHACPGATADVTPQLRADDPYMTRNREPSRRPAADDQRFLDTLIFWRSLYAERGPQDSVPVVSLSSMVAAMNRLLAAPTA